LETNRLAGKGKRFAARLYRMRVIGLGIGFFCVASVFAQAQPRVSPWLWAGLIFHGFIWPHLAYRAALAWTVPYRGERFNLMIDSALGGFWLIAMRFNILPSMLILAMLSMNSIAAGGVRLFVRGIVAQLLGAVLGAALLGLAFAPQSQMPTILACLPFMILYPLALGLLTYRLSQKLAKQARELERLSQTDGLTGLWNRRHWEDLLAEWFERCRQDREACCLVLFDLDHFKDVNDTEGHAAGDAALRSFALFLRGSLRPQDIAGRYGGEEFGVIMPGVRLPEAQRMVERLLFNLRARAGHAGEALRCTSSAGLAEYSPGLGDINEWVLEADRCLYAAKANGRDCLVTSEWDPGSARRNAIG
jgi:diguanylate cyclase